MPMSDPSPATSPHLVLVIEDKMGKRVVPLSNIYHSVGRSPNNHIRLFDTAASREHALIIRIPDEQGEGYTFMIFDGGPGAVPSTNGLFVNDEPVRSHSLKPSDRIRFGPNVRATVERVEQLSQMDLNALLGDTAPSRARRIRAGASRSRARANLTVSNSQANRRRCGGEIDPLAQASG